MTRRELLGSMLAATLPLGAVGLAMSSPPQQVDPEFLRMWNEAVRRRPAVFTDSAVIAPKAEPGPPLHLSGQLFHKDGKTPASGIIVQAYQTDAAGHYLNSGDATWRLQGWVRTNGDGRFTFDTIHPGAYPSRTTAAHIHLQAEGRGVVRQSLETIYFEGDPLLTSKDIADSERLAPFRTIWPVRRTANGEACDIRLRVAEIFVF